jgi:hypothetical protein
VLLLLAGGAGWLLARRRGDDAVVDAPESGASGEAGDPS